MKKKNLLLSVVALAFLVSACATYNCPTYSKAPMKKPLKENKI